MESIYTYLARSPGHSTSTADDDRREREDAEVELVFHAVSIRQEEEGFTLERRSGMWLASAPGLPPCASSLEREALAMLAEEALAAGELPLAGRLRQAADGGSTLKPEEEA